MRQQVHFITVATADLAAARRFYRDGLGWRPTLDVPGEIIFFQIGPGMILGFFEATAFGRDMDPTVPADVPVVPSPTVDAPSAGVEAAVTPAGFTLAYNVASPAEVDQVLTEAVAAGGTIRKTGRQAAFGGYHGHFADPNGTVWEVAYNPGWQVAADGTVTLGPVDA
ncbi:MULTISPECIES: VOC family protein [unclassified Solwaraspora]|uniref:VOC family protein n=1 Tax=unclassified Solwaraspora TaxID=2627926 RepID=UPI00259B7791|nr:VOC family protein [Solwaraspora sp. WMMA2056]WJK41721.1 VOC family protein [Solwaraspora sp. WMMA2056]